MFDIKIYEDRHGNSLVGNYLDELNAKAHTDKNSRIHLKKIAEYLNLLKMLGTRVGFPVTEHIEDDIWELRPINDRFFFAYWKDETFVILHHYAKKGQKAPLREIEQAKRNLKDFLERSSQNGKQ